MRPQSELTKCSWRALAPGGLAPSVEQVPESGRLERSTTGGSRSPGTMFRRLPPLGSQYLGIGTRRHRVLRYLGTNAMPCCLLFLSTVPPAGTPALATCNLTRSVAGPASRLLTTVLLLAILSNLTLLPYRCQTIYFAPRLLHLPSFCSCGTLDHAAIALSTASIVASTRAAIGARAIQSLTRDPRIPSLRDLTSFI